MFEQQFKEAFSEVADAAFAVGFTKGLNYIAVNLSLTKQQLAVMHKISQNLVPIIAAERKKYNV